MQVDTFSSYIALLGLENLPSDFFLLLGPGATNPLTWQPGHVAILLLFSNLQLRFHLVDGG